MNYIKQITMYSRPGCSRCDDAEKFLRERDLVFVKKNVENFKQALLKENPNLKKLPIIRIDDELIGSIEELKERLR